MSPQTVYLINTCPFFWTNTCPDSDSLSHPFLSSDRYRHLSAHFWHLITVRHNFLTRVPQIFCHIITFRHVLNWIYATSAFFPHQRRRTSFLLSPLRPFSSPPPHRFKKQTSLYSNSMGRVRTSSSHFQIHIQEYLFDLISSSLFFSFFFFFFQLYPPLCFSFFLFLLNRSQLISN